MKNNQTYAGIDESLAGFEFAKILLQSIPYDGTSTWGKGADRGFEAFLDASENMELYDIETDSEVYTRGVHLLPEITESETPEAVYNKVLERTRELLQTDKFLTFFGGEHSISIGIIEAFQEKYDGLTVLQLDAHTDLRKEYMGTPYNHACAMHHASQTTDLVQVGIRSMDSSEKQYLNRDKCYFAEEIHGDNGWMDETISIMENDNVYISIDLDVFDPSIMPATGTPEPGGLLWNETIQYLKKVFALKNVVGFDIVELAPIPGNRASQFLAAKLYYKLLSYKYHE
jgi:agmatinase